MFNLNSLINQIKKEAIETGSPTKWNIILSEKIESLRSSKEFPKELIAHITSEVERKVTSHFNSLENLKLSQQDYERLKQSWHDCLSCRKKSFVFSKITEYGEKSVYAARLLIKYLEINNKVEFFEPRPTEKFTLSYEQEIGTLANDRGFKLSPSRSLIRVYKSGVQLVANVHFFLRPCPVCSRYADDEGTLTYCPECNEQEYIAYPTIEIGEMMTLCDDGDDDFPNRSNSKYRHGDWSDDDIDDIFEGDPDNAWNVD